MDTLLALPVRGRFYGVRGSFPADDAKIGGHTTCHTIQFGNTLIIFDTGSGMLTLGNELMSKYLSPGKTLHDLDRFMNQYAADRKDMRHMGDALMDGGFIRNDQELHVVIMWSHVHGDHLFGLQAFKPIFLPKTHIHMIGGLHNGLNMAEIMERFVFAHPIFPVKWEWLNSKRELQVVQSDEHFTIPCDIGRDIKVWCLPMNHPNQAYGYRFEWGGKVVTVTLDHEHNHELDRNIVRLWDAADIVVTEVQYTREMYAYGRKGFGHITADAAADHALEAMPKRVITTHHDPDAPFEVIQEIARTIDRSAGIRTEFAIQGMVF